MTGATEKSVSIPRVNNRPREACTTVTEGKPHVLHVVDSLEIGGLERLVHDLTIARGAETTSVACLISVGGFGEALRSQGIGVQLIGTKGGFLPTVWRLRRHLLSVRPDLVHCHNLYSFLNGAIVAWLAGDIPVVMTKHGASVPGSGIGSRMNRLLVRRAHVVAVSHQVLDVLTAWTPDVRSIHSIANGISLRPYEDLPSRLEARMELGLPPSSFIIGIVARVTRSKGHRLLLDVFARLQAKIPNALLVIVGDGAEVPAVNAHVRKLGLEDSVVVTGERHDVPTILAAMNVFCLPSDTEGMPMTILEAMAAGLPVVASNVGGVPELLKEGCTGLMVPPRGPDELEAALLELANDPKRAEQMGTAGRARLLKEFSLEHAVGAYEEIYRTATA